MIKIQPGTYEQFLLQKAGPWSLKMCERLKQLDEQLSSETAGFCVRFAREAAAFGFNDEVQLTRLGEIVHAYSPEMKVDHLPLDIQDVIKDRRFTTEERVDVLVLRIAFPPPVNAAP